MFWASYDHVVAQKSIFWTKISKKVVNTLPPPLVTFCRDIYDVHRRVRTLMADDLLHQITIYSKKLYITAKGKQGGGNVFATFFEIFVQKIDF